MNANAIFLHPSLDERLAIARLTPDFDIAAIAKAFASHTVISNHMVAPTAESIRRGFNARLDAQARKALHLPSEHPRGTDEQLGLATQSDGDADGVTASIARDAVGRD